MNSTISALYTGMALDLKEGELYLTTGEQNQPLRRWGTATQEAVRL